MSLYHNIKIMIIYDIENDKMRPQSSHITNQ